MAMSTDDDIPRTSAYYNCLTTTTECKGVVRVWDVAAAAPVATLIGVLNDATWSTVWRSGVNLVVAQNLLRTVQLWQDAGGAWQWAVLPLLSMGDMQVKYGLGYQGPLCSDWGYQTIRTNRYMAFNPNGTIMATFCHTGCVRACMEGGWGEGPTSYIEGRARIRV